MVSVQLSTLALLLVAAAVVAHPKHRHGMSPELQQDMKDCANEQGIPEEELKASMHSVDAKYGCAYACLLGKAEEKIKADSPMAKDLASCKESVPASDDKCAYAYAVKACMKVLWEENHKNKKAAA